MLPDTRKVIREFLIYCHCFPSAHTNFLVIANQCARWCGNLVLPPLSLRTSAHTGVAIFPLVTGAVIAREDSQGSEIGHCLGMTKRVKSYSFAAAKSPCRNDPGRGF